MNPKLDMSEDEMIKLMQIFDLDDDGLLIRFHQWLVDQIGSDLLKHNIDSVDKERYVIYRKLEHDGAKRVHSLFEKEYARVIKKSRNK